MRQLTECCCFSLRTGALIIGVLHLIGSLISLAGIIEILVEVFVSRYTGPELKVPIFLLLVLCCVQITFNILLIVGTKKGKPGYVRPWLVFNTVLIVLATLGLLIFVILLAISASVSPLQIIILVVVSAIALGVNIYLLRVVYCFYYTIKTQVISRV